MLSSLPSLSRLSHIADSSHSQQANQYPTQIMSSSNQVQPYVPGQVGAPQQGIYPQLPGTQPYPQTSYNPYGGSAPGLGTVGAPIPQGQPLSQPFAPSSGAVGQPYPSQPVTQWNRYLTPLQAPQSLESVSKDEDPIYGPLERARGKIDRGLRGDVDISGDLEEKLGPTAQIQDPYAAPPSSSAAYKCCSVTKRTPLPDALHQELNFKHLTAKMGLFEEIERAWFTVDNKLFLWDYGDGRDFSRYDEQTNTIQAVGLVKARKDVFVDDITHVLIICTSTKATLLGLSRSSTSREILLYHTNLSVDTPTVMVDIKGTDEGRIFVLGANKDLYELDYSSDSSWLFGSSTSVRLKNRTSGGVSNWVPSVVASKVKAGIESFAVDSQQRRLYTLHTGGEIEFYDVSANRFDLRSKYNRLKHDLNRDPKSGAVTVVSISAIGGHESKRACLVAIASNGVRAYFVSTPSFYPIMLRAPPPLQPGLSVSDQSIYTSGTFIAVQYDPNAPLTQTHLTFAIPQSGRQSALRENYETLEPPVFQEWTATEIVPSQVWTIVEMSDADPKNSPASLRRSDGLALSSLPRQAEVGPRGYLVLAASGLFWVDQPRPVDMLKANLDIEKDVAVNTIRMTFGKTQLAAMALLLGSTPETKHPDLLSSLSTILLTSGEPVVKDSTGGKTITYSSRHDGLALIIARYLRPIWSAKVTSPLVGGKQILGIKETALSKVQANLESLRRYLEEHPFQSYQVEGEAKIAWAQEEMSLHGLNILLKQAVEAISFVLLLSDYKITDIVAKCDPTTQSALAGLTFESLITSLDGRAVARKLVTALIEQQIGQELGIDTLSEILQQRCGTFIQPGDVVQYKAEESMRRAETTRDPLEKAESLAESLRLFTRAAGSIPIPRLQEVSERYRALNYTLGAIELALRTASDLDPHKKAIDFVRDGEHPADPRKALFEARKECYAEVIKALKVADDRLDKAVAEGDAATATQSRNEAYALAIASDDELFHFYLYDWHVERGLQEQLLEFDTPFIEDYLKITINNVEDRRDLLWKFYARREQYLPAAEALAKLATRPSPMPLHDRLYYLAQALTSAKSAASLGSEDVEFTSRLQEQIDVAQVQMEVARAVEVHPEMTGEEKLGVLAGLNDGLLQLDELYQNYARPFRLYEPILLILKTADTRVDDVCEAVWRQLLGTAGKIGGAAGVSEIVKRLGRRYFPSEAAPIDIMIPVVYAEAAGYPGSPGWASTTLLDAGVPLRDLWEAVTGLYENSDDEEREFYAEQISILAQRWMSQMDEIPAAEIERFASAYILRTNGASDDSTRAIRDKLLAAKQVAVKY
ncbi:nuclear pore complex protein Nup155 [Cryptococcus deuterogattii LA55]|nr:nuclear pore complex protein Nup155 [Cryptococcus deuterogattii LA55]KIR95767.1 nuclear pore complex protein Nup155 [Cryptococcus deuterogattii CBS 10090]